MTILYAKDLTTAKKSYLQGLDLTLQIIACLGKFQSEIIPCSSIIFTFKRFSVSGWVQDAGRWIMLWIQKICNLSSEREKHGNFFRWGHFPTGIVCSASMLVCRIASQFIHFHFMPFLANIMSNDINPTNINPISGLASLTWKFWSATSINRMNMQTQLEIFRYLS